MKATPEHNDRIAKMTFASVYPHYITKAEKKQRTKSEVDEIILWLTGYTQKKLTLKHSLPKRRNLIHPEN